MTPLPFKELFAKNGLTLDRLQVVAAVAEAGSISKAAESDPSKVAQMSRQIGELADFFGAEILIRSGRGTALTPFGRRLAEQARLHLALLDDLRVDAAQERQLFTIAGPDSILQGILIPKLAQICGQPLSFRLRDLRTCDAHNAVTEKTSDFAVVRSHGLPSHLKAIPFGTMSFGMAAKSPFNSVGEAFTSLPLALTDGDGQIRGLLNRLCAKHKVAPRAPLQCQSFAQVRAAVATGKYVGIGPVASFDGFHLIHDEAFAPLTKDIVLAWSPAYVKKRPAVGKALASLKTLAG
jgi:DNA-binding transcriptional LysR family regulator